MCVRERALGKSVGYEGIRDFTIIVTSRNGYCLDEQSVTPASIGA